MSDHADFIEQGFATARDVLMDVAARAELHLRPETLTKAARRRCMAGFRQIAVLVRRLIFLMALSMQVPPAAPRAAASVPQPVGKAPGALRAPRYRLPLVPGLSGAFPERLRSVDRSLAAGPVAAAPALARWAALHRLMEHPERHALRLARTLQRWQAAGEHRPHIAPFTGRQRLGTKFSLVTAVLPRLLKAALERWPDTS
ncbi:MAG: hypothetical protein R3C13_12470 [Hyphomonas sp.]|uniref:hypothetical protein n=1 Tax=Hyphomonas sp. TaxID=87 RepID=UPI0035273BB1